MFFFIRHRYVVNIFLILTQFGFCAVYFVFMGDTLRYVSEKRHVEFGGASRTHTPPYTHPHTHTHQVLKTAFEYELTTDQAIAIVLPLVIICSWIRELESLTPFSLIANVCTVFSLAVIFYEILYQLIAKDGQEMAAIRRGSLSAYNLKSFPLYFGTAVYAFEGIGVVRSTYMYMYKCTCILY